MELLIIAGIILALLFNFVNGLNDAANVITTVVATKALTPLKAVFVAATFTLIGPFLFSTAVAKTVGTGIIDPVLLTTPLILSGLVGAIFWIYFCTYFGIPVSSSHSLVGGVMGAGIGAGGFFAVLWPTSASIMGFIWYGLIGIFVGGVLFGAFAYWMGDRDISYFGLGGMMGFAFAIPLSMLLGLVEIRGIFAVVIFIIISPILGFIAAYMLAGMIIRFLSTASTPTRMNAFFKRIQIIAASMDAIGYGANNAQNAMGIITILLLAGGYISFQGDAFFVPFWVIIASCGAISLGTLLGGWKVVDKMAHHITKISPYQGFSASTSSSIVLFGMSFLGIPVSTTHATTGSIMGAGATRGPAAVRWGVVREIVAAWIITVPAAALVSYCFFVLNSIIF